MDIELICNTDDETLFANIRANARSPYPWLRAADAHDGHAVIVGGGPSVAGQLELIQMRLDAGQTIFALNAACQWLNKHGITPHYQVILDARPRNLFLIGEAEHYLFGSQVDPILLRRERPITLWHPAYEGVSEALDNDPREYVLIGGGTTVGLSAMCLAYAMGYRALHLYGYDSSHGPGKEQTHAYWQDMTGDIACRTTYNGRVYRTTLTMARQAELFPVAADLLIDRGCTITVDGDGLLPDQVRDNARQAAAMVRAPSGDPRTFACVLYQGQDVPEHSRGIFDESWVDKLYRGIRRHCSRPFRFVCFVDRDDYRFAEEGIETMPLSMPYRNMFSLLEPFREDLGRVIFMGLDTIITGSLDDLYDYDGPFAMLRDPNDPLLGCSGVMSFPYTPSVWQAFVAEHEKHAREQTMFGVPSDMIFLRTVPHVFLDDRGIYSYKCHIKANPALLDDARIVYFHGREKPHEIEAPELLRHWA